MELNFKFRLQLPSLGGVGGGQNKKLCETLRLLCETLRYNLLK